MMGAATGDYRLPARFYSVSVMRVVWILCYIMLEFVCPVLQIELFMGSFRVFFNLPERFFTFNQTDNNLQLLIGYEPAV
mgnify:CR=1 FL=1